MNAITTDLAHPKRWAVLIPMVNKVRIQKKYMAYKVNSSPRQKVGSFSNLSYSRISMTPVTPSKASVRSWNSELQVATPTPKPMMASIWSKNYKFEYC